MDRLCLSGHPGGAKQDFAVGFQKGSGSRRCYRVFALALWFSKDLVLDLSSGSQTVELKDIQVSESLAHTGIFSHHYYLTGSDNEDEILRLEISGEDYGRLQQGQTVRVEYYKHTGRIVKVD